MPLCKVVRLRRTTKHEPNCVHVLTLLVERLATEEEKVGMVAPEVLNWTTAEFQPRYRKPRA